MDYSTEAIAAEANSTDTSRLIGLAKAGEASAWQQLLNPLQGPLYRFLCRSVSASDAYDVLQQTLMTVFRKIDQCQQPERFKSWVFQIAFRQMLNFQKKNKHPLRNTAELVSEPEDYRRESDKEFQQDKIDELHKAIDLLSPKVRQVVWLRLQENLSFKQISEITGDPMGTVLGRMHQGKQRLKKLLTDVPS